MKKPQNSYDLCLKTKVTSQFLKSLGHSLLHNQMEDFIYEPLKGGGSASTLYRFDLQKQSYVLRLFPLHAPPLIRMHQIMLAKQAGEMGFGPKIHFVDFQMNGMIMEFIPGRTVDESDFEDVGNLTAFAKFLQCLHNSSVNFPLAVSPFKRFREFYLKMEKTRRIFPSRFPEVKILMEDLEGIFQVLPINQAPAHLDLHPLNIMICKHSFVLVDWVNGGLSDPYFDLATFCVFHGLNEERTEFFLTSYFERELTHIERNRFIITQPIRLFVIAAALFSSSQESPVNCEEIIRKIPLPTLSDFAKKGAIWPHSLLGESMFQSALTLIDQERFRASLQSLKQHAGSMFEGKR